MGRVVFHPHPQPPGYPLFWANYRQGKVRLKVNKFNVQLKFQDSRDGFKCSEREGCSGRRQGPLRPKPGEEGIQVHQN